MNISYSNLDLQFTIDGVTVYILNLLQGHFHHSIPMHSHGSNCYEIHYIPYGYGKLRINDQSYDITPNTLYMTGPHISHTQTPQPADPMMEYCVYLKLSINNRSNINSPVIQSFLEHPFWFGQDKQDIHILLKQIFDELKQRKIGYQQQVKLLLSQLLIHMVRNYEQHTCIPECLPTSERSDKESIIIEDYFLYEYQSLSLRALSQRLNLSPRQTQRLLLEYYNKSFQEKKTEARMSAAAILLEDTTKNISSIADALGYSSAEHFSAAFRKYYHISPREFRKRL